MNKEELKKEIIISEKYFELIYDLLYDYDGLNTDDDLKGLIDEVSRLASLGRARNITESIFCNKEKQYNILGEELKGEK